MERDGFLDADDYKKLKRMKKKKLPAPAEPAKEKRSHPKWFYSTKGSMGDAAWSPDDNLIQIRRWRDV